MKAAGLKTAYVQFQTVSEFIMKLSLYVVGSLCRGSSPFRRAGLEARLIILNLTRSVGFPMLHLISSAAKGGTFRHQPTHLSIETLSSQCGRLFPRKTTTSRE